MGGQSLEGSSSAEDWMGVAWYDTWGGGARTVGLHLRGSACRTLDGMSFRPGDGPCVEATLHATPLEQRSTFNRLARSPFSHLEPFVP